MSDINNFQWWQDALAGKRAPIDVNTPQAGFYKVRRKSAVGFVPVAYWWDTQTGELRCHMDGSDYNDQRALEIWPFASKNPVSREDYGEKLRSGKWPGEHAAVVGHNAAPPDDSLEAIAERIADLGREAEKMIAGGAAKDQATADQASDLAGTFGELENKIKGLHKAEKEPHLEAGRVVDRKWFGLRDVAADLKARLKLIVETPFLIQKKKDADGAAVAAIASGAPIESVAQPKITAGSSKRPTGLRTYYRAEIEDRAKLLDSLKDHPDVVACLQKIADAAASKKVALPGCRIIADQRAA